MRALLLEAREQFAALDVRLARCDAEIRSHLTDNEPARRVRELLGIGPLTASALVATVSNASSFRNGRQFGAWLGLTPQQNSSGGKSRLGKVTRRGDGYLRGLLVQGARSVLQSALRCQPDKLSRLMRWVVELFHRKGYHKTLVAIANKHARML
ncbi:transposase [Paraburkholderia sp. BCC1885]|uniref:transposase n=1 Tax=Paraburkholderia sp. BCC1885 TaxID=2562669 RepID=UPI001642BBBA|nr:transposase [Paraburkholderia sp. BCC1885]